MEILVVTVAATSVGLWDEGERRVKKGSGTGHRRAMKGHERTKEGWVKKWSKTLLVTYSVEFLGQRLQQRA